MNDIRKLSRREILKLMGAGSAICFVGCKSDGNDGMMTGTPCVVTPQLTEGPYFVDERLNRSNIVGSQPGLPLSLAINVYNASTNSCSAFSGIQIDVWHANALGDYSDIGATAGQNFLRGYQVTDAGGNVRFSTIYPGWYRGRATHLHVKARIFNATGAATLEATTQLFFDDTITDRVYGSIAPYRTRGSRDTRNAQDSIFGGLTSLLLPLSGSNSSGFSGAISIGIRA